MPALHFRPALWPTLLTLGLVTLFVALGEWQLDRARSKEAQQAKLDAASRLPPLALPAGGLADPAALQFRRVVLRGRYDAAGQILLDNRVAHGRAGLHVITPLILDGAGDGRRVLVNRGWIPAPAERGAPVDAAVPDGPLVVEGTAVLPPRFFALGADTAPAGGNAIWQQLDLARYQAATARPLQPLVIELAADAPGGFGRDWPRPDARADRHRAYAGQWFGFAATATAFWLFFCSRRGAPAPTPRPDDPTPPHTASSSAVEQPAAPTR